MHYTIESGTENTSFFIKNKLSISGIGMRQGYPNSSGMGMGFDFSSPLGMGRITRKYLKVGYGDGEGETRPHPAPLPCLIKIERNFNLSDNHLHFNRFIYPHF